MTNDKFLLSVIGFIGAVGIGEHGYSSALSSPITTDIMNHPPDKVWKLFWWSSGITLLFAIMIAYILHDYWSLVGAILIITVYWYMYSEALEHTI